MRRLTWVGFGVVGLCFAGLFYVAIFGLAVVHDDTGEVVSAVVTNDRQEQAMLRLPGGLFVAVPRLEGTIEMRCRNGAKIRWGYVTGGMQTSVRVSGSPPCTRIAEEL